MARIWSAQIPRPDMGGLGRYDYLIENLGTNYWVADHRGNRVHGPGTDLYTEGQWTIDTLEAAEGGSIYMHLLGDHDLNDELLFTGEQEGGSSWKPARSIALFGPDMYSLNLQVKTNNTYGIRGINGACVWLRDFAIEKKGANAADGIYGEDGGADTEKSFIRSIFENLRIWGGSATAAEQWCMRFQNPFRNLFRGHLDLTAESSTDVNVCGAIQFEVTDTQQWGDSYASGEHNIFLNQDNAIGIHLLGNTRHVGLVRWDAYTHIFGKASPASITAVKLDYARRCMLRNIQVERCNIAFDVTGGSGTESMNNLIIDSPWLQVEDAGKVFFVEQYALDTRIEQIQCIWVADGDTVIVLDDDNTDATEPTFCDDWMIRVDGGGAASIQKQTVTELHRIRGDLERSENKGLADITGAVNLVTVAHGLLATPQYLRVTPRQDSGDFWIDTIGAVNFNVNFDVQPGGATWYFDWKAQASK